MKKLAFFVCLLMIGLLYPAVWGQEPARDTRRLTLDWIQSDEARRTTRLPALLWCADGSAWLYDNRLPPAERTLDRFDPATGRRQPALDAAAVLQALRQTLSGDDLPKALPWPETFDSAGRQALYILAGDVYLLDIPTAAIRRLTSTPDREKNAAFSPDGRMVSYVRENNLYVTELGTGRETALTSDGSDTILNGTLSWVYWEEIFGRHDTAYWWSPDSQAVAFFRTDDSTVGVCYFPNVEPATPSVTRQRYPKAGTANPDVRLGIVPISSGETTWVEFPDPQPEYIVRVGWLPHSRQISLQTLNRRQNRLDLYLADRTTGTPIHILREENRTALNLHDDLYFLADGRRFLWSSERDGYNHLYLYEINGELIRQMTAGEWMVRASSGVAWVRGGVCTVDEKEGWVYFTANQGLPVAPALFRTHLHQDLTERVSREEGTHRISFSPDGAYYFDEYADSRTLPGLYLHRADGTRLYTVSAPSTNDIADFDLQFPEFLTVEAADGFRLPAQIYKPATLEPGRKYPVILYVYGGPSAPVVWNNWNRYSYFNNLLLQEGYICFLMDNRSATGLSKTLEDTAYGHLVSQPEVDDILAGVQWLRRQPWIDPERIGVWGWSGGGTMTLQLMTHSDAFTAGIAVAAVTDFRYYDTKWAENILDTPQNNPEGYRASAAANFAHRLQGRLMLIHGTGDDNVHPQNAWRFARELNQAGILFEMMIYPLGTHGIGNARDHVFLTMLDFWKRNL
ncbi:MAG: DPP IV N-terminal domain-containing protein [Acidobacteria bacterium]|nr:DPP IV N-terminal domain-containing protein [Acidobacteriota bacterium]